VTVIIPTHERIEITTINIKLLLKQGFQIILVVSTHDELRYYSKMKINVIMANNSPLGAKWQAGVNAARKMNLKEIVILGSDDLLSNDFLLKYNSDCFTGFTKWYIQRGNELYLCQYMISQPLGGGRIYPRAVLDAINWQIFNINRNKLLDDYGWSMIKRFDKKIINEPEILAVKGKWKVINPVNLYHENIKHLATFYGDEAKKICKEKFDYDL
jgi:hypothetical protein